MTQRERVLKYITDFGSITRAEAFTELGVAELSSRIGELERDGHHFNRETVQSKNRYGDKVTYTRYTLRRQNNG